MARTALGDLEDPRKQRYLDWLVCVKEERFPRQRQQLAEQLGVTERALQSWQRQPEFRAEWDKRARDTIGTPERTQAVLDTLYAAAVDPTNKTQVQAAKLYLEATNSIRPPSMEVTVRKAPELSDDELDALIAQGAMEMRAEREQQPG